MQVVGILNSGQTLCFDASDLMPAEMNDAFNQAVLDFLGNPQRATSPRPTASIRC